MWAALQDRAAIVTLLLDKEASIDNTDKVELLFLSISSAEDAYEE